MKIHLLTFSPPLFFFHSISREVGRQLLRKLQIIIYVCKTLKSFSEDRSTASAQEGSNYLNTISQMKQSCF